MKNKTVASLGTAIVLFAAFSPQLIAGDIPRPGVPKTTQYSCPDGWRLKFGSFRSNENTSCVPDVDAARKAFRCPPGQNVQISNCELQCVAWN